MERGEACGTTSEGISVLADRRRKREGKAASLSLTVGIEGLDVGACGPHGKGTVSATTAAGTQRKGGVLPREIRKLVACWLSPLIPQVCSGSAPARLCLSHGGGGNTRQRQRS